MRGSAAGQIGKSFTCGRDKRTLGGPAPQGPARAWAAPRGRPACAEARRPSVCFALSPAHSCSAVTAPEGPPCCAPSPPHPSRGAGHSQGPGALPSRAPRRPPGYLLGTWPFIRNLGALLERTNGRLRSGNAPPVLRAREPGGAGEGFLRRFLPDAVHTRRSLTPCPAPQHRPGEGVELAGWEGSLETHRARGRRAAGLQCGALRASIQVGRCQLARRADAWALQRGQSTVMRGGPHRLRESLAAVHPHLHSRCAGLWSWSRESTRLLGAAPSGSFR